jgi:class 3 adenylate cyclase
MQRSFAEHNQSAEEPILVRVGMNAGEPIAEDDPDGRSDLFGTAVIEAARIAAAAKGGEILVSDVVRQLAKGKDFLFADRGEVALKGFDEPVRLYEVRWE